MIKFFLILKIDKIICHNFVEKIMLRDCRVCLSGSRYIMTRSGSVQNQGYTLFWAKIYSVFSIIFNSHLERDILKHKLSQK